MSIKNSENDPHDDDFKRAQDEEIDNSTPKPPEGRKDNKLLAIIAMNIAAFSVTGMTATYRSIATVVRPVEFNLLRNSMSFIVACIWCRCLSYNPVKEFPSQQKFTLLVRIVTG